MSRIRFGALVLAAAVFVPAPPVSATCTGVASQPVGHFLEGLLGSCQDGAPVQAFIYLLGSGQTGTNSGIQNVVCEDVAGMNEIGQTCQPEAGIIGDGRVTVLVDWGPANPLIAGCPNPAEGPDGSMPIGVHIVCNDGTSVVITTGFASFFLGYLLEVAHPGDPSQIQPEIPAASGPGPQVISAAGDQYTFHLLDLDDPNDEPGLRGYWSDCDPGAAGFGLTCDPAVPGRVPDVGRGKVYIKDVPCVSSGFGGIRLSDGWVVPPGNPPGANALDANGDVHLQIAQAVLGCRYVGATQTINGVETLAVSGVIPLPSGPVDVFQIDTAVFQQNTLSITFSTINESHLVGFNLHAGSLRLNPAPILAAGGSHIYTFETTRGALKGNKTLVLEGLFGNGTSSFAPPFPLK